MQLSTFRDLHFRTHWFSLDREGLLFRIPFTRFAICLWWR